MRGFRHFVETIYDDPEERLKQFQAMAAQGAQDTSATARFSAMDTVLSPQEVQRLGLTPNDQRVYSGSLATAPYVTATYPFLYLRNSGRYKRNPAYRGQA